MQLTDALDRADLIIERADLVTVNDAARLMGKKPNTVRMQLGAKKLVGKKWGREWQVPVLWDQDGKPIFLMRPGEGDK